MEQGLREPTEGEAQILSAALGLGEPAYEGVSIKIRATSPSDQPVKVQISFERLVNGNRNNESRVEPFIQLNDNITALTLLVPTDGSAPSVIEDDDKSSTYPRQR
jgi:hypothetical protein